MVKAARRDLGWIKSSSPKLAGGTGTNTQKPCFLRVFRRRGKSKTLLLMTGDGFGEEDRRLV
jgi:hypothetical protein